MRIIEEIFGELTRIVRKNLPGWEPSSGFSELIHKYFLTRFANSKTSHLKTCEGVVTGNNPIR